MSSSSDSAYDWDDTRSVASTSSEESSDSVSAYRAFANPDDRAAEEEARNLSRLAARYDSMSDTSDSDGDVPDSNGPVPKKPRRDAGVDYYRLGNFVESCIATEPFTGSYWRQVEATIDPLLRFGAETAGKFDLWRRIREGAYGAGLQFRARLSDDRECFFCKSMRECAYLVKSDAYWSEAHNAYVGSYCVRRVKMVQAIVALYLEARNVIDDHTSELEIVDLFRTLESACTDAVSHVEYKNYLKKPSIFSPFHELE